MADHDARGQKPQATKARYRDLIAGCSLPRHEIWALLEYASGRPRELVLAHDDDVPEVGAAALFSRLAAQRLSGMPLAYLTGEREFYGRRFWVSPHTLIPRSETELLIETTLACLAGPGFPRSKEPDTLRILDLGTGSGCIAVTLALELEQAVVHAVDVSAGALQMAAHNAAWLGAGARVHLHSGDWWQALGTSDLRFHAIVSNPPYVATGDPHLERGDLRFEPMLALSGAQKGDDVMAGGLAHILHIIGEAPKWLAPSGVLVIEHGYDQQTSVIRACERAGLRDVEGLRDLSGTPRLVLGRRSAE